MQAFNIIRLRIIRYCVLRIAVYVTGVEMTINRIAVIWPYDFTSSLSVICAGGK